MVFLQSNPLILKGLIGNAALAVFGLVIMQNVNTSTRIKKEMYWNSNRFGIWISCSQNRLAIDDQIFD
jgi:hypothetical protein